MTVARKQPKIRVEAYVHVGDKLVNVDDLDAEKRELLARKLTVTMLNAAYKGKARFWYDEDKEKEEPYEQKSCC